MTTKTVRVGYDTYAVQGTPSKEFGSAEYLRVLSGARYAFLWARLAPPRRPNINVGSSILRVYARGASTGVRHLQVQRVTKRWTASKLNWNNKPGVTGAVATKTIGSLADGDVVDIDITAITSAMVSGAANHGLRLITDATNVHLFYGADAGEMRPRVITTWSKIPEAPAVRPTGTVAVAKPTFVFDYDGDGDVSHVQLQIDATGDGTSPDFDSGAVLVEEPELNTAATAFGGLTNHVGTLQRGRVKVDGVFSEWSDWESIIRSSKGTLTILNPSSGVVTEPTPPLLASFTGEDLTAYRVMITSADRSEILWDTQRRKADDPDTIAVTPPEKVNGRRLIRAIGDGYSVCFRAFGDPDRVQSPGDPVYVEQWADFVLDNVDGVTAPTGLVASANGDEPGVILEFTIGPDAPDSIVVFRNGKIVEGAIPPEEAIVTGTIYRWIDVGAQPHNNETYTVAKVVNGQMSPHSNTAVGRSTPAGVWLVDRERDLWVGITGIDVDNWTHTEQGATYEPDGSPYMVRITSSLRGLSGSFRGELRSRETRTRGQMLADLWKIKERPARTLQLIAADWTFPVTVADVSAGPHPDAHEDDLRKVASFTFQQVGDFPFQGRV